MSNPLILSVTARDVVSENIGRRRCIPVINVRGTHYEIGFDIGRIFAHLIRSFVSGSEFLKEVLPFYETEKGRAIYDATLAAVRAHYPQYVREVQGTADGAELPFHKLFLLQMDDIIEPQGDGLKQNNKPAGCTSICLNEPSNEILGHTEDALHEVLNHIYLVAAHVVVEEPHGPFKVKEERFVSLCYAGSLPGYTMGYNHHGLVYSINTISAAHTRPGKMPRSFITRSLLAADTFSKVEDILLDKECGAANSCSVNLTFLDQEGDRLFHNIELGPKPEAPNSDGSLISTFTASPGEFFYHVNRYSRLKVPEAGGLIIESSDDRLEVLKKYPKPQTKNHIKNILSDRNGKKHKIFADGKNDYIKTVAAGIFDLTARTWSVYIDDPATHEPIVVLPLLTKNRNTIHTI